MSSVILQAARVLVLGCFAVVGSITIAQELEQPPVKYVFPFEIVEKEGGYKAGDDLLVKVHFCINPKYEQVYYNSITQSFVPIDGGEPVFTDPIVDMIVDKTNWSGNGVFYTDMDGYHCLQAFGAPKRIPVYTPPGCYRLHFVASVDGKSKKHMIEYESDSFCI